MKGSDGESSELVVMIALTVEPSFCPSCRRQLHLYPLLLPSLLLAVSYPPFRIWDSRYSLAGLNEAVLPHHALVLKLFRHFYAGFPLFLEFFQDLWILQHLRTRWSRDVWTAALALVSEMACILVSDALLRQTSWSRTFLKTFLADGRRRCSRIC